jgi:hypothetical protein
MSRTRLHLAVLAAATVLSSSARAEEPVACTAMDEIIQTLAQDFAERPVARGLHHDGTLINVFASDGGKTFTVVIAGPGGVGCVVAGGTAWESLAPTDASAEALTWLHQPRAVAPQLADAFRGHAMPR